MTKRCPITYQTISEDEQYSEDGLKLLSPKIKSLQSFPYSTSELRKKALEMAEKLSIQGVQYKLSAKLFVSHNTGAFKLLEKNGTFILKPQSDYYPHLPENEDLTMRLASTLGIEVPLHGMIYGNDGELTYFIKRFDRATYKEKIPTEDFAQLAGLTRETKYNFSMEKIVKIIDSFCTFPQHEKYKLFMRTVFNFVIGNEDMHLKNFSVITRNNRVELAPAYDFINSILVIPRSKEEIALPLNGKKNNLTRKDFIDYFANDVLGLSHQNITGFLTQLEKHSQEWDTFIDASFLSQDEKMKYAEIYKRNLKLFFG